ncbi:hypothetical protein BC936DRAFT_142262 [Jimgerdemannia flammicorona]|uniref:Ubiquitin-like domain-containing protein n=1 Tax=Jimgerdemannia flammicorona TaxID=994334 RepID=A0A433DFC2_9FUNG|nr:hypothetical protein BC936DRAFT_142262 [Jimgerdemannia flammicorona]
MANNVNYFSNRVNEDTHRTEPETDPENYITITITRLDNTSDTIRIKKKDQLDALLEIISAKHNATQAAYTLKKADGTKIDLNEDDLTMTALGLTTQSVIVMVVSVRRSVVDCLWIPG